MIDVSVYLYETKNDIYRLYFHKNNKLYFYVRGVISQSVNNFGFLNFCIMLSPIALNIFYLKEHTEIIKFVNEDR